jgi:cytochrome c oxidase assembly protein subunit 11
MLGLSYAAVPFYQIFCQTTGFGGTIQRAQALESPNLCDAPKQSCLTVQFNADTSPHLPWTFQPSQKKIQVYPGDTALTFYIAENQSNQNLTGISTYHVSPPQMGIYFNKIQCFCFEEQLLKSHEQIEMPVLFYIDKEFLNDPKMKNIKNISLSYTFFPPSPTPPSH